MKRAVECGLDTNPTRADEWKEIVAGSSKLQEQAEARGAAEAAKAKESTKSEE